MAKGRSWLLNSIWKIKNGPITHRSVPRLYSSTNLRQEDGNAGYVGNLWTSCALDLSSCLCLWSWINNSRGLFGPPYLRLGFGIRGRRWYRFFIALNSLSVVWLCRFKYYFSLSTIFSREVGRGRSTAVISVSAAICYLRRTPSFCCLFLPQYPTLNWNKVSLSVFQSLCGASYPLHLLFVSLC